MTRIVCFQAYSEEILKVNLVPENAELHQDYCITWLCNPFNKGSKSGASSGCAGCQGSGMKVSIRQLGPGMLQQMRHVCPDCKGSGLYPLCLILLHILQVITSVVYLMSLAD